MKPKKEIDHVVSEFTSFFTRQISNPSGIIFRLSDESPENIEVLLKNILPMVESEILKGAIVIIEDDRFRVRELPIL